MTLEEWANVSQIVGLLGIVAAVFGVFMARKQLVEAKTATQEAEKWTHKAEQATTCQLILMLDQGFYTFDIVRRAINSDSDTVDGVKVNQAQWFRYMALFERIGYVLSSELISPTMVNELYGQRFEKLVGAKFSPPLELRPETVPEQWPKFILLWQALEEKRPKMKRAPVRP